MSSVSSRDRFDGCILGLAIGDALGFPVEFISSVPAIRERYGPEGVTGFLPAGTHPAGAFSDDTQMSIAVARSLIRAGQGDLDLLMKVMGEEFVAWSRSPENDRAPGGTCLRGCRNLARGVPWKEAGVSDSKGCGAAMRVAPIGLFFHDRIEEMVRVAAASSALTHRHPTALASSVAAASAVAWAAAGKGPDGLLAFTRECVSRLTNTSLLEAGCERYLVERTGTGEMLRALDRTESALEREEDDVCQLLGGAWIGEEAVACALWCVIRAGGRFREAVLRAANSSGDSDSIACIAGSVAGALEGIGALPDEWVLGVEKSPLLGMFSESLFAASEGTEVDLGSRPELDLFGVWPWPPA